jgi:hypothetical protein
MALAWVEEAEQDGHKVLEVRTGKGSPYYEIFLATRPELMRPDMASQRTEANFYSSRRQQGVQRAYGGRSIFTLPHNLLRRFRNGRVYCVVKSYRDERGNGPAVSPVMSMPPSQPILRGIDPEGSMPSSFDFEETVASLDRSEDLFSPRAKSYARSTQRRRKRPHARATTERPVMQSELAGALALVGARLQAMTAADPAIPGRPSLRDHVCVLSHLLAQMPSPDGRGTAAGMLNARIRGLSRHQGGARELEHSVLEASRHMTRGRKLSRETAIPAILAALGPVLTQILPQLLPAIMPMLQGLLARLTSGSQSRATKAHDVLMASVGLDADGRMSREQFLPFLAALGPVLSNVLPAVLPMLAQMLPSLLGARGGRSAGLTASGTPAPSTGVAPSAPAAGPPPGSTAAPDPQVLAAQIQAALASPPATGGSSGTPAAGAQIDPAAFAQLFQSIGGAGGGAGIGSLLGGSGHQLIKSVVDRLPIEKMFDGQAWIPKINHDQWIQTLPWERVLSLSDSASVVSSLFVPGRKRLARLEGVELDLVDRSTTRLGDEHESWIFVADEPARFDLRVRTGSQPLRRPFVDVRVSQDGTPRTGIQRSVFRVESIGASQSKTIQVELPPAVLQRAPRDGRQTCISMRLIEKQGEAGFRGKELRSCFYVVNRHSLVLDAATPAAEAPDLSKLAALRRVVPQTVLGAQPQLVQWEIDTASPGVDNLGRYVPVRRRQVGDKAVLVGGLQISPMGLVDLAKRIADNDLNADRIVALKAALEVDLALRHRLSLTAREAVDSAALPGGSQGLAIRTELATITAQLVSFTGVSPHGNPSGREVTRVRLPIPRGISINAA